MESGNVTNSRKSGSDSIACTKFPVFVSIINYKIWRMINALHSRKAFNSLGFIIDVFKHIFLLCVKKNYAVLILILKNIISILQYLNVLSFKIEFLSCNHSNCNS